jgi:D-alanyl-D-alanine carboxypeptidase (penicillin-binding protein 5/6)
VPCFLLWRRDRRPIWAAATGAVLGAAALTGELALPVAGLMLLLMLGQAWRRREWRGALVAVGCFGAIAGWWYVRNVVLYGDPLAGAATRDYLAHAVGPGPLIRTPPSLSPDVLSSGFTTLVHSAWYDGGWNQIHLPTTVDLVVSAIAAVSLLLTAFLAHLRGGLVLVLCAIGSVVGWLLLLRSTTQGEGRYLLVAIVAWAVFLVAGSERLIRRRAGLWLWPILLGALDGYVLLRWLVPYAHL